MNRYSKRVSELNQNEEKGGIRSVVGTIREHLRGVAIQFMKNLMVIRPVGWKDNEPVVQVLQYAQVSPGPH